MTQHVVIFIQRFVTLSVVLVAGLALSACGSKEDVVLGPDGQPLESVRLQTDWYPQPEHGGFYQAKNDGTYASEGLAVTILPGGPNSLIYEKLLTGRTDFAIGRADDVIMRRSEGMPLVIVGVMMQHDPQCIMLHASNPIDSFAELDGQRVMATPGSNWIRAIEAKFGITMEIVAHDYGMERFLADETYIQQAFVTNEPFYIRKNGAEPKVLLVADAGFDPYRVIFTTESYARENPEIVNKFVSASMEGWDTYLDSEPTSETNLELIELNLKLDPEFVAYSIQTMIDRQLVKGDPAQGQALGKLDPSRIQQTIDTLAELELLENPVTVDAVVWSGM